MSVELWGGSNSGGFLWGGMEGFALMHPPPAPCQTVCKSSYLFKTCSKPVSTKSSTKCALFEIQIQLLGLYAHYESCMQVRKAEKAKLKDAKPASTDDHERLVLENPNSSWFWIQYMAFLLGMAEVAKAREVAERALRKIDYRYVLFFLFFYYFVCNCVDEFVCVVGTILNLLGLFVRVCMGLFM